jgi:hypothetical protein
MCWQALNLKNQGNKTPRLTVWFFKFFPKNSSSYCTFQAFVYRRILSTVFIVDFLQFVFYVLTNFKRRLGVNSVCDIPVVCNLNPKLSAIATNDPYTSNAKKCLVLPENMFKNFIITTLHPCRSGSVIYYIFGYLVIVILLCCVYLLLTLEHHSIIILLWLAILLLLSEFRMVFI